MSEFTQPLDWSDVELGMTVELRCDRYWPVTGVVEDRMKNPDSVLANGVWHNEHRGWSLWVKPEPAEPDPLPTEPGYYLDKEGDLWRLVAGRWVFPESDEFAGKHERYAPFTRLMTGAEWETTQPRREVSDADEVLVELLAQIAHMSTLGQADRVRAAGYMTGAEWETKQPRLPKHAPLSYGSWSVLHKQGWDATREYLTATEASDV